LALWHHLLTYVSDARRFAQVAGEKALKIAIAAQQIGSTP
jgi:hypothetical protein